MKYIYDEAGSFEQERNDCTVRALALSTNTPYRMAYMMLCQAGRKRNRGFRIDKFLKNSSFYFGHSFFKLKFRKPITIRKFVEKYPKGIFYAKIRGHVFTIKDGTIFDMLEPKPGQRIVKAWRVEPVNNID